MSAFIPLLLLLLLLPVSPSARRPLASFSAHGRVNNWLRVAKGADGSGGWLALGAVNRLYVLELDNLTLAHEAVTGPNLDSPFCNAELSSCVGPRDGIVDTDAWNKVLVPLRNTSTGLPDALLVCGSTRQGECHLRTFPTLERVTRHPALSGAWQHVPVAANAPEASTAALLVGDRLFVGAESSHEGSPYREAFPALTTRQLSDGPVTTSEIRMINFEQFLGLHMPVATYSVQLRCFSAPFFQNYDTQKINELNYGGKILLPNSCLDNLVRRNIQWPMLFKLSNVDPSRQRATHAGVLEFLAEEGRCYLPSWIMNQLNLQEADLIVVEYESLPKATYAKFKPMSVDFYQITNPRAMLEMELRKFSCLTKGDVIAVRYNEQVFEFQVMGLKPQNAVTIIECDINIEFEAAEGYVEPSAKAPTEQSQTEQVQMPETPAFKAFSGPGNRLDGKKPRNLSTSDVVSTSHQTAGPSTAKGIAPQNGIKAPIIVDENYKPGELRFVRTNYKSKATLEKADENNDDDGVKPFSGKGNKIRK